MLGSGNARPPYTPTGQSPLFSGSVPAQPPPGVPIGSAPYGSGERVLNDFVGNANPQVDLPLSAPVATRTEFDNLRRGVQEFAARMLEPQPGQAETEIIRLFPSYMTEPGASTFKWSQIMFNKSVLHPRAPESASRVLTHQYSSQTASLTSYGRAILVENGFFKSQLGLQIFAAQLRQLATATFQTMALQIVMAIINANSPDGNVYGATVRHGGPVRVVYHAFLRLLEQEYARFACYAKGVTNQMVVVNQLEAMLEDRGVGRPHVLIVPQGIIKMLTTEPDRRAYALTGKPPSDAPTSPMLGGYRLIEAPTFVIGEAAGQPINPFISRRAWGEYVFSDPKAVESIPPGAYHPRLRDIATFHEGNDAPVLHSIGDLYRHSGLDAIDAEDKVKPGFMARALFAGHATFKSYLSSCGALKMFTADLESYFGQPDKHGFTDAMKQLLTTIGRHLEGISSSAMELAAASARSHDELGNISAATHKLASMAGTRHKSQRKKGASVPVADSDDEEEEIDNEEENSALGSMPAGGAELTASSGGGGGGEESMTGSMTNRVLGTRTTYDALKSLVGLGDPAKVTKYAGDIRVAVQQLCNLDLLPKPKEVFLDGLMVPSNTDFATLVEAAFKKSTSNTKTEFTITEKGKTNIVVEVSNSIADEMDVIVGEEHPELADASQLKGKWTQLLDAGTLTVADAHVHVAAMLYVGTKVRPDDTNLAKTAKDVFSFLRRAYALHQQAKQAAGKAGSDGGSRLHRREHAMLVDAGLDKSIGAVWDGDGDRDALWEWFRTRDSDIAWFDSDFFRDADGPKSAILANAAVLARITGRSQRIYIVVYVAMVRTFLMRMRQSGDNGNVGTMDSLAAALDRALSPDSTTNLSNAKAFDEAVGVAEKGESMAAVQKVFADVDDLTTLVDAKASVTPTGSAVDKILNLQTSDPTLYAFLRQLVEDDAPVRLPFGFLLFMPHIRYRCGGMAALIPGASTGALLYSNPDLQMGNDSNVKVWNVHYTINQKMLVMRPENIAFLPGVFPLSYEGGADSAYYDPSDSQMIHRYRNGHHPASIFVVPTPYNWKPTTWVMDIKGQFDPATVEPSSAPPGAHYPNAAAVDARWGFTHASPAQRHGNATNPIQGGQNTVCSLGWSRYLQADSMGATSYVETQCRGIRGPSTYRGCAAVRRRQATMYKDAVVPTEHFSSVSIRTS